MDGARFDRFARQLGAGSSRRSLLRGALGGIGAAALATATAPAGRAARRGGGGPTPPPTGDNSCSGVSCGAECCEVGVSVCCDGACCFGECYGEERCCPAGQVVCAGVCCAQGDSCIEGQCNSCSDCWIGDVCYANQERNPANLCQRCDPGVSTSAWTDIELLCPLIPSDCSDQSGVCDPATGECGAPYPVNEGGACSGLIISGGCKNSHGTCKNGVCEYGPDSELNGQPCGIYFGDPCNENLCHDGECVKTAVNDGGDCGVSDVCSPKVCNQGSCVTSPEPTEGQMCAPTVGCTAYTCQSGFCTAGEKDCGIDNRGRQGRCIPGGCEWTGGGVGDDCSTGSPECNEALICASTNPCNPSNFTFHCYRPTEVPTCGV